MWKPLLERSDTSGRLVDTGLADGAVLDHRCDDADRSRGDVGLVSPAVVVGERDDVNTRDDDLTQRRFQVVVFGDSAHLHIVGHDHAAETEPPPSSSVMVDGDSVAGHLGSRFRLNTWAVITMSTMPPWINAR